MLIIALHYIVTLQMTVTVWSKNTHENDILNAIEKSMPNGIHVQGLVKEFGLSPTTLKHYLPILENEKKLIWREKIKNKHVYKINLYHFPTFSETKKAYLKEFKRMEIAILKAINHSSKWALSERLEVYNHVSTVIALTRYYHQMEIDAIYDKKDSVPSELLTIVNKIDNLSEIINKTINSLLFEFHRIQMDNIVSNSIQFLETVPKRKKGKQSKFMKKVLEDMKSDSKVYSAMIRAEDVLNNKTNTIN